MACPICKKKKRSFTIKVNDYEYNINYVAQYTQCKSCKSIYRTHPNKIERQEKKFYSKKEYLPIKGNIIYDLFKGIYAIYEKRKIIETLNNNFFENGNIIMEIACGKGYLIKKFSSNKNFKCYGTDINVNTIKKNNINFIRSSYKNLHLIKKLNPDLILINNFIEHMENLKIINKIIKKMKKNSYLIIITPDANSNARKIFSKYWSGYHSPRHKIIFTPKSIKKFFSDNKYFIFKQTKIMDPFTNILSILNLVKEIRHKFYFPHIFKVINFLLYIFVDIRQKNRILIVGKKI